VISAKFFRCLRTPRRILADELSGSPIGWGTRCISLSGAAQACDATHGTVHETKVKGMQVLVVYMSAGYLQERAGQWPGVLSCVRLAGRSVCCSRFHRYELRVQELSAHVVLPAPQQLSLPMALLAVPPEDTVGSWDGRSGTRTLPS
jgi:hypothetical protein